MALWEYNIQTNNFTLDNYPPLVIESVSDTFDEVPFNIDIYYSFYSTLFYTTNTKRVVMSGKIYKYKSNIIGGTSNYPAVTMFLGGGVGGEGRCGLALDITNCCEVRDFTGYAIENGVQRELQAPEWTDVFNGAYTANAFIRVDYCTLPILFSDASQTEIDNEYAFRYSYPTPYNVPQDLCFNNLTPLQSSNSPLTKQYCEDHIINFKGDETSPDGQYFRIEVQWITSTWDSDNQPAIMGQPNVQGVRGKITNVTYDENGEPQIPLTLYTINGIDDGKLKYGIINNATFADLEYTTDGISWTPTETFPFDFIYRKRINELGTFSYALSDWNTDIPTWDDEETAQDYIDGEISVADSANWDKISGQYPPFNRTGIPDTASEFGVVGMRPHFSQQYILSSPALYEISNALFDTTQGGISGIFEDIKKGCAMYGESVVDDIEGLYFLPFNANEVFTSTMSQNYIYFGGYQFQMQNSVNKILYPNGYKDFGTFRIETTYGDSFRSYEPYTKLYVYLPYIGWTQLDMKKYLHKSVSVRYYFDTRTGGCVACLVADSILTDFYNGQIGVQMPIKATDFGAYANAQIQTLLGFNKPTGGGIAGNFAQNAGAGLVESGAISAGTMATGVLGVGLAVQGTKTLYGLTQNNINNFNHTIGGSSSMLNMFLPQEVCFMFESQESMPTDYERDLIGLPSNASGVVGSFSGYLECEQVNLIANGATANEQKEIMSLLYSGIYI